MVELAVQKILNLIDSWLNSLFEKGLNPELRNGFHRVWFDIWRDTSALCRLYAFEHTPIGNSIHVCLQRMIVGCM